MKYWRGYLAAAILGAITWVLIQMGQRFTNLVDMVYPYVTRSVQTFLTAWTGGFPFLVWQTAVVFLLIVLVATLVLVFIFRARVIRWLGWALAAAAAVVLLHTGLYGLNQYSGPIEDDLRMAMNDYTQADLEAATIFYRDKANELAPLIRNADGSYATSDFDTLAALTGDGFRKLARERSFSIYGGDYTPVKKLGWSGLYTAQGKTGITVPLTGESAVNPDIPGYALPFAMAHEMAHRLCIARDNDADFSAFLSCTENDNLEYQYSGYFMAFRICRSALLNLDEAAVDAIDAGVSTQLQEDLDDLGKFFEENRDEDLTRLVTTVTDTYEEATADTRDRYSSTCDYLVNWHIDQYVVEEVIEEKFDPFDETQVDLSGLPNYEVPAAEEEPAE